MRKQTTDWKEILIKHVSDEGWLYKALLKLNNKRMNNSTKNRQEILNRYLNLRCHVSIWKYI